MAAISNEKLWAKGRPIQLTPYIFLLFFNERGKTFVLDLLIWSQDRRYLPVILLINIQHIERNTFDFCFTLDTETKRNEKKVCDRSMRNENHFYFFTRTIIWFFSEELKVIQWYL